MSIQMRVVGKPSKYRTVAEAVKALRRNQALEVSNGSDPQIIDSGVRSAVKKIYEGRIHSMREGSKVIFWKE